MTNAIGQIFVFNLAAEDLEVSLNGAKVGVANGWPGPQAPANVFAAGVLAVPRTLNASDDEGKFYKGANEVKLKWEEDPHIITIDLSGPKFPMIESYALYVSSFRYLLMDEYGTKIYDELLP